jgi:hypothetical protein
VHDTASEATNSSCIRVRSQELSTRSPRCTDKGGCTCRTPAALVEAPSGGALVCFPRSTRRSRSHTCVRGVQPDTGCYKSCTVESVHRPTAFSHVGNIAVTSKAPPGAAACRLSIEKCVRSMSSSCGPSHPCATRWRCETSVWRTRIWPAASNRRIPRRARHSKPCVDSIE